MRPWHQHPVLDMHRNLVLRMVLPLILAVGLPAQAASPKLDVILPHGGQRGTEVEVTLHGDRLFHPEEFIFYKPGISVKSFEKSGDDNKRVKAVFVVTPEAELGEHQVRLRCREGVTEMRLFWVGQFPCLDEKTRHNEKNNRTYDTNDEFDSPQEIPLNTTVHGTVKKEDVDYYRVSCTKGQRLSAEIEGIRLGRVFFDPYLAILDSRRFELASSDDSPLLKRDASVSLVVPEDGDYTILVRESSYEGGDTSRYRLHVGDFPRPLVAYPPAGRPGETIPVTFLGDPLTPKIEAMVAMPGQNALKVHHPFPEANGILSPSPLAMRLSELSSHSESEPNDDRKEANPAEPPAVPVAFQGILSKKEDKDWFRFSAKKGQNLRAQVFARSLNSPVDSVIIVRNEKGKQIGNNDDASQGVPDSKLDFTAEEDGTHFVNIRDQLYRSGDDFAYRIEITERTPEVVADFPYAERNQSQLEKMIAIPRGGRTARPITLHRTNTRCDLKVEAETLPAGVSLDSDTTPGSVNTTVAVFSAAADAPLAGGLHKLHVRDPGSEVSGPVGEVINHIERNNAGVFHSTTGDRFCVAVIEEAPYDLSLSTPPVPLVRNGTMPIKVTVTRKEGYTGKVRVKLPWKPPGIGAPNTIDIPGDQTEGIFELNANGDAPVRAWRLCAQGYGDWDRGQVMQATALQKLEVAEPYIGLSIDLAATHPGENVDLLCHIEHHRPFEGSATVTLHGLPHGVTAAEQSFTAGQGDLIVPLQVADDAHVGKHTSIFAQVIITENGHPIRHSVGQGGTLRIDHKPKVEEKKPEPEEKKEEPPSKKPLSRLEQLRQNAQ